MKKFFIVLLMIAALFVPVFAGADINTATDSLQGILGLEGLMYCTRADLEAAYGEDRIAGWSQLDSNRTDHAIRNASSEIDGYLISGGYSVPLSGPPENLRNYCVDLAVSNLVISAGVLENDPGGKAVIEKAKDARHFLEKVAEGKFKIPGYMLGDDKVSAPPGGVNVSSMKRMDLSGY